MASKPLTYRKIVAYELLTNFRAAVKIETVKMCEPQEGEICVKNKYVGVNIGETKIINASVMDIKLPVDLGYEALGVVVSTGTGVTKFKVGDAVGYLSEKNNAYAEYCCISADDGFLVPEAKPEYLVLVVSGLTAAIGLDKGGRIMSGETVLITAAAGGVGHIAVQWAKAADCHVIGTCSSAEKEKLLKDFGCDRIINYKKENIADVLANEYPKGIDVIWETIGGKVFETCLKNLAVKGRLLIVGGISGYKDDNKELLPSVDLSGLPEMLLFKSAMVQGFSVLTYKECYPAYFKYLLEKFETGKIRTICDFGTNNELFGMEGIIDGVEYLHSGKSIGKVMVKI